MPFKNKFFTIILVIWTIGFLFLPTLSLAQTLQSDINKQLQPFEANFGQAREPSVIVADIIGVVLTFLGIISVVLIIYAGFTWMTAGGNEEKIKKAKSILTNSVIGLIIIMASYALAKFIICHLMEVTTGNSYFWQCFNY